MKKSWSIEDISDLSGKTIIVTGANSGLGFEIAKALALKDAHTILACRNLDKALAAQARILAVIPQAKVEVKSLNLADLASVKQFASSFQEKHQRLDVLVNNAGIMAVPYTRTVDGFESQVGTNYLGHFALTGLLIDPLFKTKGSRVVTVSSTSHRLGQIDFNNLNYEGGIGYSRLGAYRRSKLANLIFAYELDRRFKRVNANTVSVAAHPGLANTNIVHHYDHLTIIKVLRFLFEWLVPPTFIGALPILKAAVDPEVQGGEFYGPGGYLRHRGNPKVVKSTRRSHNAAIARRLWAVSEQLTGVKYL